MLLIRARGHGTPKLKPRKNWFGPIRMFFIPPIRRASTTASPVVDEDGKLKGVVGVDVDIAQISTFLSKLDIGVTGSAFIISQNGDVIAYPDSNLITQTQDDKGEGLRFKRIDELDDPIARASFASLNLPSGRFQLDRSQYTAFDVNGIAYHAIFAPFQNEKWPWLVGIYVPENDFLGALYENRTANIYIAIVIGLIACLIAVVMVRGITRSLDGLRQNAQNIMRGDYKNQHDFPTPYQEVQETADAFKHMVAALEEKERQNIELTEELRKTSITTILRMSSAAEYKDHDTGQHIQRLSDICAAVSEHMGQPPKWTEMFRYAVPMHDLGKIGIPDEILMKPGPLTPEEREVINSHAGIGASILNSSDTKLLEMARIIALQHHEHWDGNGYPQSLQGLEIALEARICAIADVFDALISKRCYKDAMPFDEALRFITDGSGTQFDPACVDAFVGVKDEIWVLYETAKAMNEPA
ncbi:MAG: hypothetical protein COB46_12630 [Rhodospirillaceae bacterium]|nr:MAG: hypothetical protein COB46_12630 [Rhodospirillaceae bacterium]